MGSSTLCASLLRAPGGSAGTTPPCWLRATCQAFSLPGLSAAVSPLREEGEEEEEEEGGPVKLKQAPVVIVFAGPPSLPPSPLLGSSLALPGLIDVVMWRSPGLGLKPRQVRDGRSW